MRRNVYEVVLVTNASTVCTSMRKDYVVYSISIELYAYIYIMTHILYTVYHFSFSLRTILAD